MQRAIHSRFFNVIYCTSKRSNIYAGIKVSVHIVSAVIALKVLVGSFAKMFTHVTSLRSIARINNYNRNAIEQSFVLQKRAKLTKRPLTKFCSKFFVSTFRCKPDIGQILDSNSLTTFFCRKDNGFCNSMINNLSVSSFLTLKPFGQLPTIPFSRTFGSVCLCLNRTPNLLPMLTVFVKPIGRMLTPSELHRCRSNQNRNR